MSLSRAHTPMSLQVKQYPSGLACNIGLVVKSFETENNEYHLTFLFLYISICFFLYIIRLDIFDLCKYL